MQKRKKESNIPEKTVDEFNRETGIGYKMNIEIPLALGKADHAYTTMLQKINIIRKQRNNIVHRGAEVDINTATKALKTIKSFINYLNGK